MLAATSSFGPSATRRLSIERLRPKIRQVVAKSISLPVPFSVGAFVAISSPLISAIAREVEARP